MHVFQEKIKNNECFMKEVCTTEIKFMPSYFLEVKVAAEMK